MWAYCLLPNHGHLLLLPADAAGLASAVGETHRRYTSLVNARERWTGHLWQGCFAYYPLEGAYLANAVRYVERNPVRAGLAAAPWDYPWSSAAARLRGDSDPLLTREPLQSMIDDWRAFLILPDAEETLAQLRSHERTGRPLGSREFLADLEARTGRTLLPQRRGPKPKTGGKGNG